MKDITGDATVPFGYRAMDLGIVRRDEARKCYAVMYGDSFAIRVDPNDPRWISPTVALPRS